MNTLEILRAARAKIEKPENWTRGTFARDASGMPVSDRSSQAKCFCAIGALSCVAGAKVMVGFDALVVALGCHAVGVFNDDPGTTHADVLALFDRAIASEEAKAGAE